MAIQRSSGYMAQVRSGGDAYKRLLKKYALMKGMEPTFLEKMGDVAGTAGVEGFAGMGFKAMEEKMPWKVAERERRERKEIMESLPFEKAQAKMRIHEAAKSRTEAERLDKQLGASLNMLGPAAEMLAREEAPVSRPFQAGEPTGLRFDEQITERPPHWPEDARWDVPGEDESVRLQARRLATAFDPRAAAGRIPYPVGEEELGPQPGAPAPPDALERMGRSDPLLTAAAREREAIKPEIPKPTPIEKPLEPEAKTRSEKLRAKVKQLAEFTAMQDIIKERTAATAAGRKAKSEEDYKLTQGIKNIAETISIGVKTGAYGYKRVKGKTVPKASGYILDLGNKATRAAQAAANGQMSPLDAFRVIKNSEEAINRYTGKRNKWNLVRDAKQFIKDLEKSSKDSMIAQRLAASEELAPLLVAAGLPVTKSGLAAFIAEGRESRQAVLDTVNKNAPGYAHLKTVLTGWDTKQDRKHRDKTELQLYKDSENAARQAERLAAKLATTIENNAAAMSRLETRIAAEKNAAKKKTLQKEAAATAQRHDASARLAAKHLNAIDLLGYVQAGEQRIVFLKGEQRDKFTKLRARLNLARDRNKSLLKMAEETRVRIVPGKFGTQRVPGVKPAALPKEEPPTGLIPPPAAKPAAAPAITTTQAGALFAAHAKKRAAAAKPKKLSARNPAVWAEYIKLQKEYKASRPKWSELTDPEYAAEMRLVMRQAKKNVGKRQK